MRCVVADFGISVLFSFLFKEASEPIFRKNVFESYQKNHLKEKENFLR